MSDVIPSNEHHELLECLALVAEHIHSGTLLNRKVAASVVNDAVVEIKQLQLALKMRLGPTADCNCSTCFMVRRMSGGVHLETHQTSRPKLEDFPRPEGGCSHLSFHNALIQWQEGEIERLQRENQNMAKCLAACDDGTCECPAVETTEGAK